MKVARALIKNKGWD